MANHPEMQRIASKTKKDPFQNVNSVPLCIPSPQIVIAVTVSSFGVMASLDWIQYIVLTKYILSVAHSPSRLTHIYVAVESDMTLGSKNFGNSSGGEKTAMVSDMTLGLKTSEIPQEKKII